MHLLIVDDNEINRLLLLSIFKKIDNIKYDIAINGMDAVKKYKQYNYDLILMDCQMPILDGYETTVQIMKYSKINDLTVIIIALTADISESNYNKCISSGMSDVITKPYNVNKIKLILNDITLQLNNNVSLNPLTLNKKSNFEKNDKKYNNKKIKCIIM